MRRPRAPRAAAPAHRDVGEHRRQHGAEEHERDQHQELGEHLAELEEAVAQRPARERDRRARRERGEEAVLAQVPPAAKAASTRPIPYSDCHSRSTGWRASIRSSATRRRTRRRRRQAGRSRAAARRTPSTRARRSSRASPPRRGSGSAAARSGRSSRPRSRAFRTERGIRRGGRRAGRRGRVDASTEPTMNAIRGSSPATTIAATAVSAITSTAPGPSVSVGMSQSRRSTASSRLIASRKRTSASVAKATARRRSESRSTEIAPVVPSPSTRPSARKTIGNDSGARATIPAKSAESVRTIAATAKKSLYLQVLRRARPRRPPRRTPSGAAPRDP